ncbi:MAG: phosphate/phosphite/phosphonate ABC transporter substrate-binding protein [Gammaproteobacteria bacterium]|nr:phosphate/phosphite/phosphonate ABC transporter substrate-binding protein [Gammaproteobacteria bacterium]
MYKHKLIVWLGAAVMAPLFMFASTAGVAADQLEKLRFGLLPAEEAPEMVRQFQGIADHVSGAVGLPNEIFVSQSYNALIEAMEAGKIDVAYLGGGTYVAAYLKGMDVVPIVVAKLRGRTYYKSCIITNAKSDIQTLNDIKGKRFAFVSPTSTSGGVGPRFYLNKNDINPEQDFGELIYAGKHDSVYLAIKNDKVDAGAVGDIYFPRWKERGLLEYTSWDEPNDVIESPDIRILGCQKVPGTPMVARGELGEEMIEKVTEAYTTLPYQAVDKLRFWGPTESFIRTDHAFYEDLVAMKKLAAELKKSQ